MARPKFGIPHSSGEVSRHDYGNLYFHEPSGDSGRLVIGPTGSQVQLLESLAETFQPQEYFVLYILLVSHSGNNLGRYQSPLIRNFYALKKFTSTFRLFFENDGRHHIWIASPISPQTLVYDQHDVIFAYGDLEAYEDVLKKNDYTCKDFWFPSPHAHGYDPANGDTEDVLLEFFDWQHFDLQPGDEWD